jgi:four helix bundle protein
MSKFRFEDLDIWKESLTLTDELFDLSELLREGKMYSYSEQLSSAALSITNNIAEGSGSNSKVDFYRFLNFSHRSAFECANMVFVANRRKIIEDNYKSELLDKFDLICRKIISFKKAISN